MSIIMTYDKNLEPATINHFDLGIVTYSLILTVWSRGIER